MMLAKQCHLSSGQNEIQTSIAASPLTKSLRLASLSSKPNFANLVAKWSSPKSHGEILWCNRPELSCANLSAKQPHLGFCRNCSLKSSFVNLLAKSHYPSSCRSSPPKSSFANHLAKSRHPSPCWKTSRRWGLVKLWAKWYHLIACWSWSQKSSFANLLAKSPHPSVG